MEVITLEKHVESIKEQLRPNRTNDVNISDEWIADMIHASRSALVPSLYTAKDMFMGWHQPIILQAVRMGKTIIGGYTYTPTVPVSKIALPGNLMQGMGFKNILYFGNMDMGNQNYERLTMNGFLSHEYHRYGNRTPVYTVDGGTIYIKNISTQKYFRSMMCFEQPTCVPDYSWSDTLYPIPSSAHRRLEIVTFQHIAAKLGMPVDMLLNGLDETKNAPVNQQVRQQNQNDEQQ